MSDIDFTIGEIPPLKIDDIKYHVSIIHEVASQFCNEGKLILSSFGQNPDTEESLKAIVEHFSIGDIEAMVDSIIKYSEHAHRNLYIPLAIYKKEVISKKRGRKDDILSVLGLVADFDDKDAVQYASRLPIPSPYILETSFNRFQCFYLFDSNVLLHEAEIEAKKLKNFAKCDHGTGEVNHVWRIAGTLNWPNAKKVKEGRSCTPQLVKIVVGGIENASN